MRRSAVVLLLIVALAPACRSVQTSQSRSGAELVEALAALRASLPPQMAALYRLRIRSTGGLRLAVLADPQGGRLSISEPFGALVSVTGWNDGAAPTTVDLRADCRLDGQGLAGAFGFESLPVAQLLALLGGRLPAVEGDRVTTSERGEILINGRDWAVAATVEPSPWRVTALRHAPANGPGQWRVELGDHSSSVPGSLRFVHADGRWAELELVRLAWEHSGTLPPLPDRPPCGELGGGVAGEGAS